jgi:hypothetical protein
LVQKVNPVSLLTQSGNIGYLGEKSENMTEALTEAERDQNIGSTVSRAKQVSNDIPVGLGTFVIICFLTAAICIIGIVVFFNLTFVFIARVVMLWLAMILSPIAFFSHTTPELENLKFIGFKNWLKETASMAFVAPIFCFFLYIIITFLDSGLGITDAYRSPTGFEFVLRILIPFLFLSVLLMKAKDIAISMSGQAGKFVSDMGNKIAGTTIGLATGGAAMAMRGTVGAMGARMARSETLTNMEKKGGFRGLVGGTLRNAGLKVGQKSFDFRNTAMGEKAASGLGISGSVKKTMASGSKPGVGFLGNQEEKVKKVEKRQADLDKLKPKTEEEKEIELMEKKRAELAIKIAPQIKEAEEKRDVAKQNYEDAKEDQMQDPKNKTLQKAVQEKKEKYREAREVVSSLKKGGIPEAVAIRDKDGNITGYNHGGYATTNGNISQEIVNATKESAEKITKEIKNKEESIKKIEDEKNALEAKFNGEKKNIEDRHEEENTKGRESIKQETINLNSEIEKVQKEKQQIDEEAELAKKQGDGQKHRDLSNKSTVMGNKIGQMEEDKVEKIKDLETKFEKNKKEREEEVKKEIDKLTGQKNSTMRTLNRATEEANSSLNLSEEKRSKVSKREEIVKEAVSYAEKNGGLGVSKKEYIRRKEEMEKRMIEKGDDPDSRNLRQAKKIEGERFFDWVSTGGSGVHPSRRKEWANSLYEKINKNYDK